MFGLSERLRKFMFGRYGNDNLNYALFVLYAILGIVNLFTRKLAVSVIMTAVLVIIIVRALSKNIYTRVKENDKFNKAWYPTKNFIKLCYNRFRERKTNVYRKCPSCKAVVRLPKVPGEHTVKCPKCQNKFGVNIK